MSSSSQFEAWSQIIPCQWSARPSRLTPARIARAISASLQAPIPVAESGVMFRTHNVPNGFQLIFNPPLPSDPWHMAHEATLNT